MTLDAAIGSGLVKVAGRLGQRDEEVEPDLVVPLAAKVEKVLCHMEKLTALDFLAKFFAHFSDDRGRRLFADFDSATRQRPILVTWGPMKEYVFCMKNNCRRPNLEALAVEVD